MSLTTWITEEVVVFDRGFLFTAWELLVRPVEVTNNFISGITKRYYNPFKLLLILTTVLFLVQSAVPQYRQMPGNIELLREAPEPFTAASVGYFALQLPNFLLTNLLAYFLITIPLWSLLARYLFRKRALNYMEHMIHVSFTVSGTMVVLIAIFPILELADLVAERFNPGPVFFMTAMIPVSLFYMLYVLRAATRFYGESFIKVIAKGLVVLYVGLLISYSIQFLVMSCAKYAFDY